MESALRWPVYGAIVLVTAGGLYVTVLRAKKRAAAAIDAGEEQSVRA